MMSLPEAFPVHPEVAKRYPVQRDCERAACRALGIQCQERRSSMPCKEVGA